jgi:hypothetical protein
MGWWRGRYPGQSVVKVREVARSVAQVLVASPWFLAAPLYRHWHLRWGATDAEVAAAMPGDTLVPDPSFNATRAITIQASPELVWPWIVQLGAGRAGFYSYDLLDNAARPSADEILPEFQETRVGDWVPMASKVTEATAFKVEALEPDRWLLWGKPHSSWAWTLSRLEGGGTRLVTRLRERYPWRSAPGAALLTVVLFEFGDFPMMRKLLLGIRGRAEALAAQPLATPRPYSRLLPSRRPGGRSWWSDGG